MLRVLLIEDNPGDQRLAVEAFKQSEFLAEIEIRSDGSQALEYLAEATTKQCLPDLVLLDLNLPRVDGREILTRLKGNPRWRHIPVLVLSSSTSPEDIAECYRRQANCYLIKPMDIEEFFDLIRRVEQLWFPNLKCAGAARDQIHEELRKCYARDYGYEKQALA